MDIWSLMSLSVDTGARGEVEGVLKACPLNFFSGKRGIFGAFLTNYWNFDNFLTPLKMFPLLVFVASFGLLLLHRFCILLFLRILLVFSSLMRLTYLNCPTYLALHGYLFHNYLVVLLILLAWLILIDLLALLTLLALTVFLV
jgi:hypothetical protein